MNSKHAQRVLYFQQIKRVVPLAAVLEKYGVLSDLKKIGTQLFGTCPVHKGTNRKQFVCDLDKGLWKCFGDCNSGGDALALVAALEKVEVKEAARLLSEWFAIASPSGSATVTKQRRSTMSGEQPSHKAFVVEDKAEGS